MLSHILKTSKNTEGVVGGYNLRTDCDTLEQEDLVDNSF